MSLRGPPDLEDTRLELSWNSKFAEVGDQEDFKRGRLYVALTKLSSERTQANYYNSIRLQIWPAKDYAHLFLALSKPHSASLSSSKSSDDASYADTQDISNDIDSSSPLLDSSSDGNNNHDDDRKDNDEDNDFDDDSYNAEGASNAEGSDSNGYDGNGYDSDGSDDGFDAGSTGSQFSQKLFAQWLARCQNNEDGQHLECNRTEAYWLPTRLIDVNFTSENPVLRLASPAETPEMFEADRRYITLSHCWGE